MTPSPLDGKSQATVFAGGHLLQKGQSVTVSDSKIGAVEKSLQRQNKISIIKGGKPGTSQILCTLS